MTVQKGLHSRELSVSSVVARNTGWNLLGALLPLPVALVCIPLLIAALGVERFGVLGIAWMLLGYFGMFDLGLAQSTTRFVSERIARGDHAGLNRVMRASLSLHCALGLLGGAIFALLTPVLVTNIFVLPPSLQRETEIALYLLAASVPAIVVTAALRGMLEGLQRFDVVNLIRVPASMVNYAGPLVALSFGTALPSVVAVIVAARYVVLAVYGIVCFRLIERRPAGRRFRGELLQIASYGGWLTVSNLANPLIVASDRFVVAATVSIAAVAHYVAPYEVITKGWIVSASLMGALFPVFAARAARDPASIRQTCRAAQLFLLSVSFPAIALLIGSADFLLTWWLSPSFGAQSSTVARLLAIGLLINIMAQVPLTALNAIGRADISAGITVLQLPIYLPAIWYAGSTFGIEGIATAWAGRAALDATALFVAARLVLPSAPGRKVAVAVSLPSMLVIGALVTSAWLVAEGIHDLLARFAVLAVLVALCTAWVWHGFLSRGDRQGFKALMIDLLATRAR